MPTTKTGKTPQDSTPQLGKACGLSSGSLRKLKVKMVVVAVTNIVMSLALRDLFLLKLTVG